jgi:hypothetical protein
MLKLVDIAGDVGLASMQAAGDRSVSVALLMQVDGLITKRIRLPWRASPLRSLLQQRQESILAFEPKLNAHLQGFGPFRNGVQKCPVILAHALAVRAQNRLHGVRAKHSENPFMCVVYEHRYSLLCGSVL